MITEIEYSSWSEFKKLIDNSQLEWIYRGQASSMWNLSTPLERSSLIPRVGNDYTLEDQIIEEFQRISNYYLDPSEYPINTVEWLALIQHYGTPTRFIDFTKSPYIAAYFAFENETKLSDKVSIWIIDKIAFYKASINYLAKKKIDNHHLDSELKSCQCTFSTSLFDEIFHLQGIDCIFPIESLHKNERFYLQQSIFLSVGNPKKKFLEQLEFTDYLRIKSIIKLDLPYKLRNEALRDLYKMNITRASLFPGLDGFAKTINMKYSTPAKLRDRFRPMIYLRSNGLI